MPDGPNGEPLLYSVPGGENAYDSIEECWDAEIDAWDDIDEREIEEWTTHPPRYHLPTVDRLLEWVAEMAAEYGELSCDHDPFGEAVKSDEAAAAADALLDVIAAQVRWRQCDRLVRTFVVRPSSDGGLDVKDLS